ncbi:DAHL domain-containing protein [Mesorhizobium sp. M0159]|uniref:DAHL domain-containing protein n=1 Tax=Mesorhizobium sp. M0159 TaxID=2956900 RepID=UPI003335BC72
MKSLRILAPIVACMLIALTYLLVQGTAPDAARHERTLDALRTVILYNAALQRDVLRARAGLLRSYDPLVRSIENLDEATQTLPAARDAASGETRADIDKRIAEVIAAIRDEEALVERFKSDNALLQNSLNFFNYMSGRLTSEGDGLRAVEIGALMVAMSRFISDPQPDAAKAVTAALDRLARPSLDAVPASDVLSLVSHGRLMSPGFRRSTISSPACRPRRRASGLARCRTSISVRMGGPRRGPNCSRRCFMSPRWASSAMSPTCSPACAATRGSCASGWNSTAWSPRSPRSSSICRVTASAPASARASRAWSNMPGSTAPRFSSATSPVLPAATSIAVRAGAGRPACRRT